MHAELFMYSISWLIFCFIEIRLYIYILPKCKNLKLTGIRSICKGSVDKAGRIN